MKREFDIKFRPKIESGEYKVETELGNPAIVMDWEWNNNGEKCLAVKIPGHGKDSGLLFNYNGKRAGISFPGEDGDLFIVTPEPELTEFEEAVKKLLDFAVICETPYDTECIKTEAAELLTLARKQLQPEIDAEIEKAYKTADEVQYRKGREEALKDLPRWKKAKKYMKLGPNDFVFTLDSDGKCSPYWDTEVEAGQFYITESDIENLPKEDE